MEDDGSKEAAPLLDLDGGTEDPVGGKVCCGLAHLCGITIMLLFVVLLYVRVLALLLLFVVGCDVLMWRGYDTVEIFVTAYLCGRFRPLKQYDTIARWDCGLPTRVPDLRWRSAYLGIVLVLVGCDERAMVAFGVR